MDTSKLNSGGHPAMDLHPNQERVGISQDTSSPGKIMDVRPGDI